MHKDLEIHAHWDLAHPMNYFSAPHTMNANFDELCDETPVENDKEIGYWIKFVSILLSSSQIGEALSLQTLSNTSAIGS